MLTEESLCDWVGRIGHPYLFPIRRLHICTYAADVTASAKRSFDVAYNRFLVRQRVHAEVVPPLPGGIVRADPRIAPQYTVGAKFVFNGLSKRGWSMNATIYGACAC